MLSDFQRLSDFQTGFLKRSWLKSPGRWWFQTLTCGVDPLLVELIHYLWSWSITCGVDPLLVEWIHLDWNHQLVKLSIGPCFGWCSSVVDGDFFHYFEAMDYFWVVVSNIKALFGEDSHFSKKSPTGSTERTPQLEYLIALATYWGVRW